MEDHRPGDVFQINGNHRRAGWVGAFVMALEVHKWGISGFVSHIDTHESQWRLYVRLDWGEVDFVGPAPWTPTDEAPFAKEICDAVP